MELATGQSWQVQVTILPKAGVNDPAGDSIKGGLEQLGYQGVDSVRAGKVITLNLRAETAEEARSEVERMCGQLLANPVIETYQVVVDPLAIPQEVR